MFNRIIGHDASTMDHDMGANALDCLQLVRTEQHHLSSRSQFLYEAAQHERGSDIGSGERLIQQDKIGIVQEGRREKHLLPQAF